MVERSRGLLSGRSRTLVKHHKPSTLTITDYIKDLKVGDKVVILPKKVDKTIPHPKYRGRVGTIIEKRGKAYVVEIELGKHAKRKLIVEPLHLEKLS